MIKINVVLTFSKILSLLILLIGCISALLLDSTTILEITIPTSAALSGIKTFTAGYTQSRTSNNNKPIEPTEIIKPKDEIG